MLITIDGRADTTISKRWLACLTHYTLELIDMLFSSRNRKPSKPEQIQDFLIQLNIKKSPKLLVREIKFETCNLFLGVERVKISRTKVPCSSMSWSRVDDDDTGFPPTFSHIHSTRYISHESHEKSRLSSDCVNKNEQFKISSSQKKNFFFTHRHHSLFLLSYTGDSRSHLLSL